MKKQQTSLRCHAHREAGSVPVWTMLGILALSFPAPSTAKTITLPSGAVSTIQLAVNRADPGDTILVKPGVYGGSVLIDKPRLTLRADGPPGSVKVVGQGFEDGLYIVADDVTVQGFDISGFVNPVVVSGRSDVVRLNHVHDCMAGIIVGGASGAEVDHNEVAGTSLWGIVISDSSGNVHHNSVSGNTWGILLHYRCSGVQVHHNTATGNGAGIALWNWALTNCGNTLEHNLAFENNEDLVSDDDPEAPCNVYRQNRAETAYPSQELWDAR